MRKRIFALVFAVIVLAIYLCIPVFARQTENAFPFSDYTGKYFWITTGYPAWERDLREKSDPEINKLMYHNYIHVSVLYKGYREVEEDVFNLGANQVARQTGYICVSKVDGLWEEKEKTGSYPKIDGYYDIQDVTNHDEVNDKTDSFTTKAYLKNWRNDASKGLKERQSGVREVVDYKGGWLYKYSVKEVDYDGNVKSRWSKYKFMRPIPEIPDFYLVMTINFTAGIGKDGVEYNESQFIAYENKWMEAYFTSDYIIEWSDDFRDYTKVNETTAVEGTTQWAEQTPGEDSGISVPGAIVIGVAGGAAGLAALAAAIGGGSSNEEGDKKNNKSYKMYVQKDFGDAIKRGGDPVPIRARMAEVESGIEKDRNDLTANIKASGDGIKVNSVSVAGRYLEAMINVPKDCQDDRASITFTYTGVGGSFANTVMFRVIDGPSIKFVEETEEKGSFKTYENVWGMDMIPGDGFTYTSRFLIMDAMRPPKLQDITADKINDFDISFEETDRQYLYKIIVKNNTKKEDSKEKDVFAKKKEKQFEFKVVLEDEKEPLKGNVTLRLYPEGITVSSDMEGKKKDIKYIRVQAYEKEEYGDLDKKWQVSEIKFNLAVVGKEKSIINPKESEYTFDKLKGSGGKGIRADKEQSLAEKYKYKETSGWFNDTFRYTIEPNATLSDPDDGTFYLTLLPVKAEYDGIVYEAEIPIRLKGKDPDPMEEWNKEYEKLRQRIEKYSLPSNKDKWLERLESCALDPKVSVAELRLTSKWILREYMDYWTNQNKKDLSEATMYNVIVNVLEWTKFAGDCAFSILVNMYAGPVAEALISPAKDFITSAFGEVIAAVNHGETLTLDIMDRFEFSKNLAAAGDNLLSNNINLTNWKKAAATLSGYFVYCAVKNYIIKLREENVSDVWGAICEAFKDMTLGALKSKAGDLIGKWLKDSKKFQEKILPYLQKYFQETQMTTLQHKLNDALGLEGELRKLAGYANDEAVTAKVKDVVEKYIGNLVGAGFDKLRECYDTSKFSFEGGHVICCFNLKLFDAYQFGIRLDLNEILMAASSPFFGWFYDLFFAGIPSAAAPIETPKDPPLPPANN